MAPSWITVGDLRFPVVVLGNPAGPPAVLVPGLSDGLEPVSSPAARRMLAAAPVPTQRFRCLAVSHRHPARAPLTTRQLAADAAAVIERVADGPCWLFAHSMGTLVAQHLAAERPDLVAGMVLSATLARADDAFRAVLARWEALVVARRWQEFARDAVGVSFTGSALLRRRLELHDGSVPAYDAARIERHRALTSACAGHDARDRLGTIRCPTLVLAGGRDPVCPPHHAEEVAAAIPGAQLEVFAGLAHGFPEQAPRRYHDRVLRFVEAADAPIVGTEGSPPPSRGGC